MPNQTKGIALIAGLGNIGSEYEGTRHNAGFMFADALASKCRAYFSEEKKFSAYVARVTLGGRSVWLVKPTTYMNRSGQAVQAIAQYYHIEPDEILVVHDELDLPPGCMKLKQGGGNAGHNGLKDISQKLATPNFWRLRLGTGHPRTLGLAQPVVDFVLHRPSAEQKEGLDKCIAAALEAADDLAAGDFQKALRKLAPLGHLPKPPKPPKEEKPAEGKAKAAPADAGSAPAGEQP